MDDRTGHDIVRSTAGVALVLIGLIVLLQQIDSPALAFMSWSTLWPFFIIVPGVVFFLGALQGGRRTAGLAIPGSIIVTVGLILLYQNSTHHWQSWAYAWTLIFPTAIGVGRALAGEWGGRADRARNGWRMARFGIILFLVTGLFFELVLNISGFVNSAVAQFVLPAVLIVAGAFVLWRGRSPAPTRPRW